MKPDTRPTCASCGYVTDGCRCADCPPDRAYCDHHILVEVPRIEANGTVFYAELCRPCRDLYERCNLCESLTTHHTPNGVCPRCMRVVYMEAEALAREFVAAAGREDDFVDAAFTRHIMGEFRDWLMRQRAAAMPADVLAAENKVEVTNG